MIRSTPVALCLLSVLLLGGCGEDESRPPSVSVSIVNAAPGFENLGIRRGTTSAAAIGVFEFSGRTTTRFDSGIYNYTIETNDSLTQTLIERATFTDEVESGQKHLYVLAEQNQAVLPLIFSRPVFDTASASWELNVVNAAESIASVDFYAVPAGTDITTVAPTGSIQFGQLAAGGTLDPGNYEFTLTAPGDSGIVLFASNQIDFPAGISVDITIVADTNGVENRVTLLGTTATNSFTLGDRTIASTARFANGGADQLARSIYLDGDFTTPFADNIAYATVTDFIDLPDGTSQISVTPAGNASVVEAELIDALLPGVQHTILIAGQAGDLSANVVFDDRLRNNAHGRMMFLNTVSTYEGVDIYLVAPGTDISNTMPNVVLGTPAASTRSLIAAGTRELTVTDSVSKNVVLGPMNISFAPGGLYTILLYDSGDGTTVSALMLDDFQ